MAPHDPSERAQRALEMYEREFKHPFPHLDCFRILEEMDEDGVPYDDLVPHLSMYWAGVVGTCSYGSALVSQPREWLLARRELLNKSFLDSHPQYAPFVARIGQADTPQLWARWTLCERLRVELVEIITAALVGVPSSALETDPGRQAPG